MKHNLFLSMLVAALMGSGVANAADTLNASDYTGKSINLGTNQQYLQLNVDTTLQLTNSSGYLALNAGAIIEFQKTEEADSIFCIYTSETRTDGGQTVFFTSWGPAYNITFDDNAEEFIAASDGTPITLIQDKKTNVAGFHFSNGSSPDNASLKLEGMEYGETVEMNGIPFKYVGAKPADYVFMQGEIGIIGFYEGSHNLSLVAKAPAVPEPATGSLSLLALAGLCARRRK